MFRRKRRREIADAVALPVMFNKDLAVLLLQGPVPCNVGAMQLHDLGNGTFDLVAHEAAVQQIDLLGMNFVQRLMLAANDLLAAVESADTALLPDNVATAAQSFRAIYDEEAQEVK